MLRITVSEQHGWATLRVEGTLVGPWVGELERCWQDVMVTPEQIIIDLDDVSFMDSAARAVLEQMHAAGSQLRGKGAHTAYILERIQELAAGGAA